MSDHPASHLTILHFFLLRTTAHLSTCTDRDNHPTNHRPNWLQPIDWESGSERPIVTQLQNPSRNVTIQTIDEMSICSPYSTHYNIARFFSSKQKARDHVTAEQPSSSRSERDNSLCQDYGADLDVVFKTKSDDTKSISSSEFGFSSNPRQWRSETMSPWWFWTLFYGFFGGGVAKRDEITEMTQLFEQGTNGYVNAPWLWINIRFSSKNPSSNAS